MSCHLAWTSATESDQRELFGTLFELNDGIHRTRNLQQSAKAGNSGQVSGTGDSSKTQSGPIGSYVLGVVVGGQKEALGRQVFR